MKFIKSNKLLIVVGLIYIGLLIVAPEYAISAFKNSSYYLIEMIQVIPIIFMITIFIEAWIPKETITKHLGEKSGFKGGLFAFVLGSISAGPIYAAFPVSKMLLKKGAGIRNIVIILSAWAVIKVPMLANEAKFLGPKFMVVRWVLTVIAITIMATIMGKVINKKEVLAVEADYEDDLSIEKVTCIGCNLCANRLPEYFKMEESKAVVVKQPEEEVEALKKMAETCPANAIKYKGGV